MGLLTPLRDRRMQRLQRDIERLEHELGIAESQESRASMQEWIDSVLAAQQSGVLLQTTMGSLDEESVVGSLSSVVKSNGPVFALTLARLQVFSQARFQWTRFERG